MPVRVYHKQSHNLEVVTRVDDVNTMMMVSRDHGMLELWTSWFVV